MFPRFPVLRFPFPRFQSPQSNIETRQIAINLCVLPPFARSVSLTPAARSKSLMSEIITLGIKRASYSSGEVTNGSVSCRVSVCGLNNMG